MEGARDSEHRHRRLGSRTKEVCRHMLFFHHKKGRARSWMEASFQKRECSKFVPNPRDDNRCFCGLPLVQHRVPSSLLTRGEVGDTWTPARNTTASPTDAYGTIEFQGGPHTTKAQYVRLSYDTRPEQILQLLTREWNLELPKLLISVQGGKANFELQPKLKKVLRKGLLKAAKTTGAWIFTGGTNTGVTRQVGDALLMERAQRAGRVVSIGIAPWGIVENNHELVSRNKDVPYHSIASPRSKMAVLNNRHAYFLMVDNGTTGRYGAEVILRRKLEKYISIQKLNPCTHCSTPVVCLVIEGGTNTIRAVLEYVTDSPPVPVVVCDGSGRAADLLAFTHKYASETGEQTVLENMKDYLISTIMRTFEVGPEQADCLYQELLQCTRNKHLITVFRISDRQEAAQELDQTILTALFKSQHLSPSEQLQLALTWNRVDIARSEIFVYGQEWPPGALEEAMMQALEHDRLDFVKLLLENGVSMRKFLTIPRLEELYNSKNGPSNTLGYILRDVRPHIPRGYVYTLHDIGLVINKLMGGAYRAHYTRRKFRMIYAKVMKKSPHHVHRNSSSFIRYCGNQSATLSLLAETLPSSPEMSYFDHPFNELLTWAVLTKRQQMALLMWQHGEEALAKALVAAKLYKAMAHEAAEDDLEAEIYEELRSYGKEFENIALELLDFCYRQDDDQTQQLLTCEHQNWSGQTCLSLAVSANHRALLAHPCSQIILADLWMGGLRTRKNTNLKVILGLLCPAYIPHLEFKSKEELQLMPQTEEEHQLGLEEGEEDSLECGGAGAGGPDAAKLSQHRNTEPDVEKKPTGMRSVRLKTPYAGNATLPSQQKQLNLDQEKKPAKKKVLLTEPIAKDTIIQENGKIILDDNQTVPLLHTPIDYYDAERIDRPLRLRKKLYEFYTAPISKFWGHSIAYMVFLYTFSYVILVKMPTLPSWPELYVIGYITAFGCEKIRELLSAEPVSLSQKVAVWAWNMWNPCDIMVVFFFLGGLILRLQEDLMNTGRLLFCVDIIYWYLRIFTILSVNKYLGPLVTMMGKMVKNMIYFVVLLLVVLISFGVCRQAILSPNSGLIIKDIFFQPYFMLYGEVFADAIDPPCGDGEGMQPCRTGRWVSPVVMAIYLLVANILLINLLIAVFNNIFNEVNAVSHQVWMFQRFTVVMEYEQKPVLPPPFIVISHVYLSIKYFLHKARGLRTETYDHGLKLFLEPEDQERLFDFEEECVEGYFREKESKLQMSSDERVKNINERVEHMCQKIEDINQKENAQSVSYQSMEFRMRKLEELAERTMSHLDVIHRFMATQSREDLEPMSGAAADSALDVRTAVQVTHPDPRARRLSERSELEFRGTASETSGSATELAASAQPYTRRRPARSWTEARSDAVFVIGSEQPTALVEEEGLEESDESSSDTMEDGKEPPVPSLAAAAAAAAAAVAAAGLGPIVGPAAPAVRERRTRRASEADHFSNRGSRRRERRLSLGGDEIEKTKHVHTSAPRFMRTQSHSEGTVEPGGMPPKKEHSQSQSEGTVVPAGTLLKRDHTPYQSEGTVVPGTVLPRRERSLSHSEPDSSSGGVAESIVVSGARGTGGVTWVEPRVTVTPSRPPRSVLRAMHAEYTRFTNLPYGSSGLPMGITDELETVCGLLSPSRPMPIPGTGAGPGTGADGGVGRRVRHASEMSNPEIAMFLEKETLRHAEESDYQLMEGLIQHRYQEDEEPSSMLDMERFGNNAFFLTVTDETALEFRAGSSSRPLRRSSAIEVVPGEESPVPVSSPTSPTGAGGTTTAEVHDTPTPPADSVSQPAPRPRSSSLSSIAPPGNTETMC